MSEEGAGTATIRQLGNMAYTAADDTMAPSLTVRGYVEAREGLWELRQIEFRSPNGEILGFAGAIESQRGSLKRFKRLEGTLTDLRRIAKIALMKNPVDGDVDIELCIMETLVTPAGETAELIALRRAM